MRLLAFLSGRGLQGLLLLSYLMGRGVYYRLKGSRVEGEGPTVVLGEVTVYFGNGFPVGICAIGTLFGCE
jgi:hypothetical protein